MSDRRRSAPRRAAALWAWALVLGLCACAARAQQQTCDAAGACAADADAAAAARAPPPPEAPPENNLTTLLLPLFRRAPRLSDHLRLASASLVVPSSTTPTPTTTNITAAALSDEGDAVGLPLFAALGDSRGRLHLLSPGGAGFPLLSAYDTGTDAPVTAAVVAARGARSAVVCSGHADGSARCFDVWLSPPRVAGWGGEDGPAASASSAASLEVDVEPLMAWSPRLEEMERRELRRLMKRRERVAAAAAEDADEQDGDEEAPLPEAAAVLHMVHLRGMVGGGVGMRLAAAAAGSGGGGGGGIAGAKNSSSSSGGGGAADPRLPHPHHQTRRRWPPGHVAWADAEGHLHLMNARSARPWARFAVPADVVVAARGPSAARQAARNASSSLPAPTPSPRPRILALRAHLTSKQQGVQLVALTGRAAAVAYLKRSGRALARRACAGLLPPPPTPGGSGGQQEEEEGETLSAAAFDVSKPFRAFALSARPGTGGGGGNNDDDGHDGSVELLSLIVPADRRTTGCRVTHRVPLGRALLPLAARGRAAAAAHLVRTARLVASRERLAVFTADGRVVVLNATAIARGETDPRIAVLASGSVAGLLRGEGLGGGGAEQQQQQQLNEEQQQQEGRRTGRGAWWRSSSSSSAGDSGGGPAEQEQQQQQQQAPAAAAAAAAVAAGSTGRAFLSLSPSFSSSSPTTQQHPHHQPLIAVWEAVAPSSVVLAGSPQAPSDRRGAAASGWAGGGGGGGSGGRGGNALGAVADTLRALQPLGMFGMIAYVVWRYQRSQGLASDPRLMRGRAAMMAARRRADGYGGSGDRGWNAAAACGSIGGGGLRARGLNGGGRAMFSDPSGPSIPPGAYALAARLGGGGGGFGAIREEDEERYLRGDVGDDDEEDDDEHDDPAERQREAAYAAATRVARQAAALASRGGDGGGGLLDPLDPLESPAEAYTRGRAEAARGSGRRLSEGDFSERLARLDAALGHEELAAEAAARRRRGGGGGGGGGNGGGSAWGSGGGAFPEGE